MKDKKDQSVESLQEVRKIETEEVQGEDKRQLIIDAKTSNEDKRVEEVKRNILIPISSENQGLELQDHTQLYRFINQMIEAKALPKHLKTQAEVLSAWNYAAQLGLPPQPSLRNIAVIEGTPSLFGDLPLSLVQRHKDYMYYEEFTFDEEYKRICFENKNLKATAFGGCVYLQRKGMGAAQSFSFTLDDAARANLLGRNNPWKTYPQIMLIRRARIMSIRALFADAITGAAIAEDFGYAPDLRDVTPQSEQQQIDKATILNEKFKIPPQAVAPSDTRQ